ncbi:SAM-dependent methyltransferase [hydrothermal vent metagenome]|uniref:SAM-dependent methyltransferase n=1 Tax=hydrothermal vent metagenome TaxID=652676 RepID=A0A3B0SUC5_9ZZZZ
MPPLEQKALGLCKGKVLDIGCGSGSHSLYLQQKGIQVTALDSSKGAIETCHLRGVKNTALSRIQDFEGHQFDTLFLLMNGIGIAGTLNKLDALLRHLKSLLKSKGQILLDSSDLIYMFDDDDGGRWLSATKNYYGEVAFTMSYKGQKGNTFPGLYINFNTLQNAATAINFNCELVSEGEHYDYLARLSH